MATFQKLRVPAAYWLKSDCSTHMHNLTSVYLSKVISIHLSLCSLILDHSDLPIFKQLEYLGASVYVVCSVAVHFMISLLKMVS